MWDFSTAIFGDLRVGSARTKRAAGSPAAKKICSQISKEDSGNYAGWPSMKAPPATNDNMIDRTIAVW
jgi:hypothetical protein